MKALIVAGGKGTRMGILSEKLPKALIKIGGKPVIEHQILFLKKNGVKEVWVLLGYLGDRIKRYLGDGKRFGVKIYYSEEENPLGTAGALKLVEGKIREDFLFLSGDVMFDMDLKRFVNFYKSKQDAFAAIVAHPSDHPFDSDLIEVDKTAKVTALLTRPHQPSINFQNLSVASIFIFSPKIFKYIPEGRKTDFEKDILPLILKEHVKVYAYKTPEYIKDMGTPERLSQVKRDYISGKIKKFNLANKRKAVFLDRDGLINREEGQFTNLENFKLYDFSAEAIKKNNDSDYLTIVITNQPAVAKGFISEKELREIHKKMETDLGLKGAKIDAIYYCPHHPKKGFAGEVVELKIECDCRKPKIGMIKKAKKDFNLDLRKCFFVGDATTDAKTAENAGIKFIGVKTGDGLKDNKFKLNKQFSICKNLLEAIKKILK